MRFRPSLARVALISSLARSIARKMVAKSSARRELSVELDAVMEAIGAETKCDQVLPPEGGDQVSPHPEGDQVLPGLAKKTPILSKTGHRVMWLCEVDGELMVLQRLMDFRESEKGRQDGHQNEEDQDEEERVSRTLGNDKLGARLGEQCSRLNVATILVICTSGLLAGI